MRFVIGAGCLGWLRPTQVKLAIAATFVATGSQAQAMDCGQYTAQAMAQSREYRNLGCSGGLPEWWRIDEAHHRNWCMSLPAGSAEPARGIASREAVLRQCRLAPRPPQARPSRHPQYPAVGSGRPGRRPPVFQGTVCNRWDVWLRQGRRDYFRGSWVRASGFSYLATWNSRNSRIRRYVYPLNANLSFWSDDRASNTIIYYYNDRGRSLAAGQIGGQWESEAADGRLLDRGDWGAHCLDRVRN